MAKDKGSAEQIKELEDRISSTKYNKKTQHAIGQYKAQIAKLKEKDEVRRSAGKKGEGYSVQKSGDVTAVLLGFPSVGKSTILNALTNANSQVGAYAFTTLDVVPGLMDYKHAKIQVLDVPGIVAGAASGRGRGREVLSVVRSADLVIIVIDAKQPQQYPALMKEIVDAHLRINQEKPVIKITKTAKDGIRVGSTVRQTKIDEETIKSILKEFRIINADVLLRDEVDVDQFIDAIEANKIYLPAVTVINKIDLATEDEIKKLKKLKPDLMISANKPECAAIFKETIYKSVGLMNIFLKEPSKEADMKEPLVIRDTSTLGNLCTKLHKDFYDKFRFARIWGRSTKFPGQKIRNKKHKLQTGDVVELHIS